MQSMKTLSQNDLTRQERLFIWMRREGHTNRAVAKALGVGITSITRWIAADTIPTRRHRQLVDFGFPEELLPPAKDISSGPKLGSSWPESRKRATAAQ
ncbi:MAG: XRE family transcriptional regulator [Desulfovibrio sp.]|nr:XRE family transcriptional regulator [Desulfovibrio sp.]